MVENIVISWREVMLVGALVLGVYIVEMLLFLRARRYSAKRETAESVEADSGSAAKQEALQHLASRVEALEAQIGTLLAEKSVAEDTPYQRAIQMARQGREAGRITESCGISYGEAELIVSMHGPHKRMAAGDK